MTVLLFTVEKNLFISRENFVLAQGTLKSLLKKILFESAIPE
jgi:hypothetical protein